MYFPETVQITVNTISAENKIYITKHFRIPPETMSWPELHDPPSTYNYDASTVLYVPDSEDIEFSLEWVNDNLSEGEMLASVSGVDNTSDVYSISFTHNDSQYTCCFFEEEDSERDSNLEAEWILRCIVPCAVKGPMIMYRQRLTGHFNTKTPCSVHEDLSLELVLTHWRESIRREHAEDLAHALASEHDEQE